MTDISLPGGRIEYTDSGHGPVVVLIHGLLMSGSAWQHVVADLSHDHRVVVPTLPLGGHRIPTGEDADMSAPGVAALVTELMDALELEDVTLVGNDWGGAQFVLAAGPQPRVGRVVLASVEAFDNYPPGFGGKMLMVAGRNRATLGAFLGPLRIPWVRHRKVVFGQLTVRGIDPAVADEWLRPLLTDARIRDDFLRFIAAVEPDLMPRVSEQLRSLDLPALVLWGGRDAMMPQEHGQRLADLLGGRLVVIEGSGTLIPWDQPDRFASEVRAFVRTPRTDS